MTETSSATQTNEAPQYPQWWDWDADGSSVDGIFEKIGRGFTATGERAFVVLTVDGTARTIWLHWNALRSQFEREVQRRPDKTIHAGERVRLWRLGSRTSSLGREYFDFRSEFPDGPAQSQADILGSLPAAEPEGGSDVPF
jgi:hypothetical protein